jgi:hypothetical protein
VERLKEVRARIDHEALAADRAEAVDRALFDPSPEAILARKYEAAAERALYKALKELRQVEAEAAEVRESDITVETDETCEPLASNLEESEEQATEDDSEPSPDPEMALPTVFPTVNRAMEGPNMVERARIGLG